MLLEVLGCEYQWRIKDFNYEAAGWKDYNIVVLRIEVDLSTFGFYIVLLRINLIVRVFVQPVCFIF